jgi:hypothetical protein
MRNRDARKHGALAEVGAIVPSAGNLLDYDGVESARYWIACRQGTSVSGSTAAQDERVRQPFGITPARYAKVAGGGSANRDRVATILVQNILGDSKAALVVTMQALDWLRSCGAGSRAGIR